MSQPGLQACGASLAETAGHSWFSTGHLEAAASIAAVVVSITAVVVTIVLSVRTNRYMKRNTTAAEGSAVSAAVSAKAAEDSAKAAKNVLKIEQVREYDRTRPKLRGCLVPEPGTSGPTNAWLEIHLDASTPVPLRSLLLTLPPGAWFTYGHKDVPTRSNNNFGFPEAGRRARPIRPGQPGRHRVYWSDNASGTLTATAKCTSEDGTIWWDVEIPISQDHGETDPTGS